MQPSPPLRAPQNRVPAWRVGEGVPMSLKLPPLLLEKKNQSILGSPGFHSTPVL